MISKPSSSVSCCSHECELAKLQRAADINLKTIQAIWHNPHHDASFKTLDKIAKVLGVPVTELIEDVPDEQE